MAVFCGTSDLRLQFQALSDESDGISHDMQSLISCPNSRPKLLELGYCRIRQNIESYCETLLVADE